VLTRSLSQNKALLLFSLFSFSFDALEKELCHFLEEISQKGGNAHTPCSSLESSFASSKKPQNNFATFFMWIFTRKKQPDSLAHAQLVSKNYKKSSFLSTAPRRTADYSDLNI